MSCKRGRWSSWMPLSEGLAAWRRSCRAMGLLHFGRPKTGCHGCKNCRCMGQRPRQGPCDLSADIVPLRRHPEDPKKNK